MRTSYPVVDQLIPIKQTMVSFHGDVYASPTKKDTRSKLRVGCFFPHYCQFVHTCCLEVRATRKRKRKRCSFCSDDNGIETVSCCIRSRQDRQLRPRMEIERKASGVKPKIVLWNQYGNTERMLVTRCDELSFRWTTRCPLCERRRSIDGVAGVSCYVWSPQDRRSWPFLGIGWKVRIVELRIFLGEVRVEGRRHGGRVHTLANATSTPC